MRLKCFLLLDQVRLNRHKPVCSSLTEVKVKILRDMKGSNIKPMILKGNTEYSICGITGTCFECWNTHCMLFTLRRITYCNICISVQLCLITAVCEGEFHGVGTRFKPDFFVELKSQILERRTQISIHMKEQIVSDSLMHEVFHSPF